MQIQKQIETLTEQERVILNNKQNIIVLEDQVDTAKVDTEKLEMNLESYKQKYEHSVGQEAHLESAVKMLQEKLAESRNREVDKEKAIETMKYDIESLNKMYSDTKHEMQKYEDIVEQLSQELKQSRDSLSITQSRNHEFEDSLNNMKERLHDIQSEVNVLFSLIL